MTPVSPSFSKRPRQCGSYECHISTFQNPFPSRSSSTSSAVSCSTCHSCLPTCLLPCDSCWDLGTQDQRSGWRGTSRTCGKFLSTRKESGWEWCPGGNWQSTGHKSVAEGRLRSNKPVVPSTCWGWRSSSPPVPVDGISRRSSYGPWIVSFRSLRIQ